MRVFQEEQRGHALPTRRCAGDGGRRRSHWDRAARLGWPNGRPESPRDLASEKAILKAIDRPWRASVSRAAIYECIWAFGHELKIPMAFDTAALTDVGIPRIDPRRSPRRASRASGAGPNVCGEFDLTWVIEDETLMIIPRDAELKHLEIAHYIRSPIWSLPRRQ